MTEQEAFSKLKNELERAEFKCMLNLYNFAYATLAKYYDRCETDTNRKLLNAVIFASAYMANLKWLMEIIPASTLRKVTMDEAVARWSKYYTRLTQSGVRPSMTYDNGITRSAPITFDTFHQVIVKCRQNGLELYQNMKSAKEGRK